MSRLLSFGEPLIGFYSEDQSGNKLKMTVGGDTSNVALGASKLGCDVKYVTKLGGDYFSKIIWETWDDAGVNTQEVVRDQQSTTGLYFVFATSANQHLFNYKRKNSASAKYGIEEAKNTSLRGIDIFHTSGITQAISRNMLEASYYFLDKCKEENITVSYDVNYRKQLWSRDYFNSVCWYTINNYVDILALNLDEAKALGIEKEPVETVEFFLKKGPKLVALKLGEKGAIIGTKNEIIHSGSYSVEVDDTVGAGDAFMSGIIAGLIENEELEKISELASATAALVCTSFGSINGQPTKERVSKFITENNQD